MKNKKQKANGKLGFAQHIVATPLNFEQQTANGNLNPFHQVSFLLLPLLLALCFLLFAVQTVSIPPQTSGLFQLTMLTPLGFPISILTSQSHRKHQVFSNVTVWRCSWGPRFIMSQSHRKHQVFSNKTIADPDPNAPGVSQSHRKHQVFSNPADSGTTVQTPPESQSHRKHQVFSNADWMLHCIKHWSQRLNPTANIRSFPTPNSILALATSCGA